MLSIVTIPKPFVGRIGDIQRNAISSWQALHSDVEVILLGAEIGTAKAAADLGVRHVEQVERDASGTPRLDSALASLARLARHPLHAFVNADIVFFDDLVGALETVAVFATMSLTVGQSRDYPVQADEVGQPEWARDLRTRALESGVLRGVGAIDYFVFPAQLFGDEIPPFLIGRAGFDNWLIWRARELNVPVVDATADVVAVHQSHDYAHLRGGKHEAYIGPEAAHNLELAGGKKHLYSICDSSHRLRSGRVSRNPWAVLRLGDRIRRARWKLGLDRAA